METWLLLCSWLCVGGWTLSAIHQLNRTGYAVWLLAGALGWLAWRRANQESVGFRVTGLMPRLQCCLHKPLPLAFFVLAGMTACGGALYPTTTIDVLSQRIPRVLNWLAENRWHWIADAPGTFNIWACNFEWQIAPLIAFTGTDRFLFLINALSFLWLPGLLFGVFRGLGVHRRVAWHWMWIFPTGYCYLLQAGSVYSDAFGATFATAALFYALRARSFKRVRDVWLSILAAALMTGVKPTNLALLLPWGIVIWPAVPVLFRRPLVSMAVALVAALSSFLPTAYENHRHSGDWTGMKVALGEPSPDRQVTVRIMGNTINLLRDNLTPPVFPLASWWNQTVVPAVPESWHELLQRSIGQGRDIFRLGESPIDEFAGLGFGVTVLLFVFYLTGSGQRGVRRRRPVWQLLVFAGGYLGLVGYMVTMTMSTTARNLTPFYPLLVVPLLLGMRGEWAMRRVWWRWAVAAVVLMAGVVLVVNRARPLFPAVRIANSLAAAHPNSAFIKRMQTVYTVAANRWDGLAEARRALPPAATNVGLMVFSPGSCETSLWRPFGQRRIRWIRPTDSSHRLAQRGVKYVVVGAESGRAKVQGQPFSAWLPNWLAEVHGKIEAQVQAQLLASSPPTDWYVISLNDNASDKRRP